MNETGWLVAVMLCVSAMACGGDTDSDANAGTSGAGGAGASGAAGTAGASGAGGAGAAGSAGNAGSSGASGGADCEQATHFQDLTGTSAGEEYPAPSVSVTCSADTVTVKSNGIPSYEFVAVTPNALKEQDNTYEFPRNPAMASATSKVPLGGPIGVAVNGLPLFGPTEAPNDGYKDPVLAAILDFCNGHVAPGGDYHLHARPDCLFTDLAGTTSLVIGYAFDGYPILGPYTCDDASCTSTHKLKSSWQAVASQFDSSGKPLYNGTTEGAWDIFTYVEGSGDLDECNGAALEGGGYAYHSTDTFPYFIGCYRGTPTDNKPMGGMGMGGMGMGGMGGP